MKTLNKLFIAALATTAMTACNNDLNNNSLNSNRTVNFTMGIGETVSSRISMNDGEYTAKFSADNSVGIFVKDQDSYKNIEYTTTDGNTWSGAQINLPEGGTYTYYAYYPYSQDVTTANSIAINVATDQETGGYLANDYLYCNTTSSETNVALEYKHALSLVDVTLAGDAIGENATVSIINVATDATLNVTAPSVTTGSTLGDVKMDVLTNTKNFRAIIPAQTIAASTPIFRIDNEGRTYEAKYSGEISFAEGKYLALTITIGEAGGEPTININVSGSISDWTEGSSANGDVAIGMSQMEIPLPTDGKFTAITSNWSASTSAQQIPQTAADAWYKRSGTVSTKCVAHTTAGYDETEQALTITTAAEENLSKGGWNNDNVTFHTQTPFEQGYYTLSFDVKASNGVTNGIIGVGIASSNDNKVFQMMKTDDWSDWNRNLTTFNSITGDKYVSKTVNFNFNNAYNGGSTNGIKDKDESGNEIINPIPYEATLPEDVNGGINIIFYNYTAAASTLYIKNIKITKAEGPSTEATE